LSTRDCLKYGSSGVTKSPASRLETGATLHDVVLTMPTRAIRVGSAADRHPVVVSFALAEAARAWPWYIVSR